MTDEPTNVLRDSEGRVVYQGDVPPEDAPTTSSGQTAASASPWRTASPQSEEEAERPALEDDYKKAFASLDGRLTDQGRIGTLALRLQKGGSEHE